MKKLLTALALLLLCSAPALASGSSSSYPAAAAPADDPLDVTQTIRCVVAKILDDGTVIVRDSETEPPKVLPFGEQTKIFAQNKKEFDGRKKLVVADLNVGHELKVTVRPATGEVLKVKVLKSS